MIIWITGLSGSGKTTLGKSIYKFYKKHYPNTLWFDGETTNLLTDKSRGYDKHSRINQLKKNLKFYEFCYKQKINLIISCLYIDKNFEKLNRKKFKKYFQIYLKSNIQDLIKNDSKNMYKKNLTKKKPNIMGYDIKWNEPKYSDIIINNSYQQKLNLTLKKVLDKTKKNFNKF
jgi:adenylylsulfate kinase-like enzyme